MERRAPALLDSFFQSVTLAPLFVWLEVLFALGYDSKTKLELEKAVEEEIRIFRSKQKKTL